MSISTAVPYRKAAPRVSAASRSVSTASAVAPLRCCALARYSACTGDLRAVRRQKPHHRRGRRLGSRRRQPGLGRHRLHEQLRLASMPARQPHQREPGPCSAMRPGSCHLRLARRASRISVTASVSPRARGLHRPNERSFGFVEEVQVEIVEFFVATQIQQSVGQALHDRRI